MAKKANTMANEKLVKVKILRDYWDDDGIRHRSGTEIEVPSESAMDGIESGMLERVKAVKSDK